MKVTSITPNQRGFSVLTAQELEGLSGKSANWFSEQAEVAYQKQADFSCFVTHLLDLALESVQQTGDMKVEALLVSIKHLTANWDSELATFAGQHEALLKKLQAAKSLTPGEAA